MRANLNCGYAVSTWTLVQPSLLLQMFIFGFSCIQMRHQVTCEAHVEDTAKFKKLNQNPYWLNFMSELWWVGWGFFMPVLITVLSREPTPLCSAYRFRNKQKVFPPLHRYCSSVVHKYNHLNSIMSIRWYWFSSLVFYIRKLAVSYLLLRLRPVSCTPVHLHASTSSPHHSPSLPGGAVYRVKLLARFCLCSVQTSSCGGSVWILRHLSLPLSAFPSTRSFLPGSISFPSQCRCFNKVC